MQLPIALSAAPQWQLLSAVERRACWRAATKLVANMQTLAERGQQVVQAMIGDQAFIEWEHYPDNDVRDPAHASQYFYHAHTGLQRPFEEHGHFHLFVYPEQLGLRRANPSHACSPAHFLALSMDAQGVPSGFFIVNRWVTKGPWLNLAHCKKALQHFQVKGRRGCKEVNHFLRALLDLYQAQIIALFQQREAIMQELSATRDRRRIFADKEIEVLCYAPIRLMDDIAALEQLI